MIENAKLWRLSRIIKQSGALTETFEQNEGVAFFHAAGETEEGRAWPEDYEAFLVENGHRGHEDRDLWYKRRIEDPAVGYRSLKAFLLSDSEDDPEVKEREVEAWHQLLRSRFEPLVAAWYLRDAGALERLINLVANLDASVVEAELRGLDSLLQGFPDERGPVRDALWYCCLTMGANGQPTTLAEREAEVRVRYADDAVILAWYERAKPLLTAAIDRTQMLLELHGLR